MDKKKQKQTTEIKYNETENWNNDKVCLCNLNFMYAFHSNEKKLKIQKLIMVWKLFWCIQRKYGNIKSVSMLE